MLKGEIDIAVVTISSGFKSDAGIRDHLSRILQCFRSTGSDRFVLSVILWWY